VLAQSLLRLPYSVDGPCHVIADPGKVHTLHARYEEALRVAGTQQAISRRAIAAAAVRIRDEAIEAGRTTGVADAQLYEAVIRLTNETGTMTFEEYTDYVNDRTGAVVTEDWGMGPWLQSSGAAYDEQGIPISRLGSPLSEGDPVRKGQLLAWIDAPALVLERAELRSQLDRVEAELGDIRATGNAIALRRREIDRERILRLLDLNRATLDRCQIRAPARGRLSTREFASLDGRHVEKGDRVCQVIQTDDVRVEIWLSEEDVVLVHERMQTGGGRAQVEARFTAMPGSVVRSDVDALGVLPLPPGEPGLPSGTWYRAVSLGSSNAALRIGMTGNASVSCEPQVLGKILFGGVYNWFRRTIW
jgi:hypothetical protein